MPAAERSPESLAYLIYTSGSTGQPNGVEVPHRGIANSLDWVTGEMEIHADDVFLNVLTPCFDMSVFSLFLPLSNGARLVMATLDEARNADRIKALLEAHRVTVMKATPVTWTMLIEAGWQGRPDFKAAIGGEALTRPLAEAILTRTAGLWNLYGPTEASIFCVGCRVESGEGPVPIGKPVANMRAYILDDAEFPVARGSVGELYVSGAGVARGYHNHPELTAQRFLPDPFDPTERMYRTGDLARQREDGVIECLGRSDDQVKIRGYRIEPQEVEAVLAAQTEVAHCAVIPRGEGVHTRLLAYFSARSTRADGPAPAASLRERLAEQLPDYLVPSEFVQLAELPLNANGKVDRGALPELVVEEPRASREVDSLSPQEAALAGIARKLLNLPGLACDEDLFDVGMHSLLAVRMAVAIGEELGVRLDIGEIFEARTVRALAARLAAQDGTVADAPDAIPRTGQRDRIPLTWQQEQIWYLSKIAPENQAYNAQFTLRLRGKLDRDALVATLDRLIERHEIFRTSFHDGPLGHNGAAGPVQTVHPPWKCR